MCASTCCHHLVGLQSYWEMKKHVQPNVKPNVFCQVFSTFRKSSNVSPARVHQQNSNAAVCDHCQATQQHCYFADGPSRDMAYETKCVLKVFSTFPKNSKVSPSRVHQQNSNVAVCDHCRATRQHCYFADGPSRDMANQMCSAKSFQLSTMRPHKSPCQAEEVRSL